MGLRSVTRLHMGWRHAVFLNWPVESSVVAERLPDRLTVDTYDGRAWLSAVPFTNVDVRPAWWPTGWGVPIPELNLRTYVTVGDDPGVHFFNLDAQGVLGVLGGRWVHHLPYYYARIDLEADDSGVRFTSRRRHPGASPCRFRGRFTTTGDRFEAEPGSLEWFLTERYRYYTVGRAGAIRYADVDHEPWPLHRAEFDLVRNDLFAANGFDEPEDDAFGLYSPGVDTLASPNRRL